MLRLARSFVITHRDLYVDPLSLHRDTAPLKADVDGLKAAWQTKTELPNVSIKQSSAL
jgi:hypothetical protein